MVSVADAPKAPTTSTVRLPRTRKLLANLRHGAWVGFCWFMNAPSEWR
jgi:hypothetical protein